MANNMSNTQVEKDSIKSIINGEVYFLTRQLSVSDLIVNRLDLDSKKVAIEINKLVVPKSEYNNIVVNDGDVIEIIAFFGGG